MLQRIRSVLVVWVVIVSMAACAGCETEGLQNSAGDELGSGLLDAVGTGATNAIANLVETALLILLI
jgi:hypothetical protein